MIDAKRHLRRPAAKHRALGVTLLEVLVVVAIVGVLAAIGYPSYTQYITRTNRAVAKAAVLQVADRQEQFFADNKRYSASLVQLGYAADGFMLNDEGAAVADGDSQRIYSVALSNTSATTFTVNAAPQLRQSDRDQQCQTLTLTHTGRRGQTGPGDNCW